MRCKCALTFLLCGLATVGASCAPMIGVDSATHSATVQPGAEVVHVFRLTNTGDETLSIANVLASCGCTATSLEKTLLSPGESVALETKVNTAGFQGTVDKRVTVQSNDPVTPNLFLHLVLTIASIASPQSISPVSVVPVVPQAALAAPFSSLADERPAQPATAWLTAGVGAAGLAVGFALGLAVSRKHRLKGQG